MGGYRSWERRSRVSQVLVLAALCAIGLYVAGFRDLPFTDQNDAAASAPDERVSIESSQRRTESSQPVSPLVVRRVVDGDTVVLSDGRTVRLAQIDAAERNECFHEEAAVILAEIAVTERTVVRVDGDPAVGSEDRYGRTLGYLFAGERNVNLELVRAGAASVWYFEGQRGRYAEQLLQAAQEAQSSGAGLWGKCPKARINPASALSSG